MKLFTTKRYCFNGRDIQKREYHIGKSFIDRLYERIRARKNDFETLNYKCILLFGFLPLGYIEYYFVPDGPQKLPSKGIYAMLLRYFLKSEIDFFKEKFNIEL